jgi:hypothetical protein
MNWSTAVKVARYHLVDRFSYTLLPWGTLAFAFAGNLIIWAEIPIGNGQGRVTGALSAIYVTFCAVAALSVGRALPFGLSLGASRRSFYTGTALLAVTLAAGYGLALAALQAIERASGGWGVDMHFFRVPYLLAGPWYLTWLTSSVGLATLFVYGMWYGTVYRRWNLIGLITFTAAQVTVLLAATLAVTWAHAWASVGHFFTTLTAAGLTGLLAVLAVALLGGGLATIRRATV